MPDRRLPWAACPSSPPPSARIRRCWSPEVAVRAPRRSSTTLRAACADGASADLVAAGPDRDRCVIGVRARRRPGPEVGRPGRTAEPGHRRVAARAAAGAGRDAGRRPIAADAAPDECAAARPRRLAAPPDRVALLVMGDGSACRGPKAPGYDDPRAEAFDARRGRRPGRRRRRGPARHSTRGWRRELRCAGRAPWQVLAGAVGQRRRWRGELQLRRGPLRRRLLRRDLGRRSAMTDR